ncbi:hypothetical protein QJS10_CPB17g00961 [Acorus calamus]|uniref:Uncharacterized protein n=1 Tax=Acorus calamus TaxID=4465 RepID=A0AAV9CS26_ACOCL|nr:hypothetical protein QJS10_CPB17g00961 [Acorus calamus]
MFSITNAEIQPKSEKSEPPIEIFSPPPKRSRGRLPKNPRPSSATTARKTPSSAQESRPTPPSKMALKAMAMEIRKAAEALSKEADNVRVKITEFEKAAADFGLTRSAAAATAAAGSISGARFSL